MQVIVRDRRQGKTTELIKWLLEGKEQDVYPHWNRVIVASHQSMVLHTMRMVWEYIQHENWSPCSSMLPHMFCDKNGHGPMLSDIRKAVWSMRELYFNARGVRRDAFEYVIDDADHLLMTGSISALDKPPVIITLTGELYSGR